MTDITSAKHFSYTSQDVTYTASQFSPHAARARILLMPDWEGMHSRWAQEIAKLYSDTCGAEVILTDHYGQHCPHPSFDEAAAINNKLYKSPKRTREIFRNMLAALDGHWTAGGPLIVAGFCSGGVFSFETGRSGAPVDAVFSVHGDPGTIDPIIKPGDFPIFTMVQGALDPIISESSLNKFTMEMQENKIRWALYIISDAKHSFTRFDSTRENYGIGYSKRAEIETRHLVLSQILSLLEMSAKA